MLETSLKRLESSHQITSKLEGIIEAFVAFYGEERRQEITERLNNTQIVKFSSIFTLEDNIRNVKESILKELYGISEDKYLGFSIEALINFLTKKDTFAFDYMSNDIKTIMFGDSEISAMEVFSKFQNNEFPKLNEFLAQYENIKPVLAPYEKIIDEENLKASKIREKYYDMLVHEFANLFSQDEIEYYQKYNFPGKIMKAYLDMSLFDNGHCFDDKHEKLLNDENTPKYKKDSITDNRLKFLGTLGYNYKSYDECLNDPKCAKLISQSREICQKISTRKTELYRLQTVEIIENTVDYKCCRQEIDRKQYINKNDSLGPFVYESIGVSCCEANYVVSGDELVLSPLVLINAGASNPDCTIIHELNHALEYYTVEVDNSHCKNICGWDYDSFEFKQHQEHTQLLYKGISRGYELLSEYINDRIAQEITDIMHNQGNYILSNKRGNDTSSYMTVRFLVEKFYNEFKDIIIASRSNGNIDYLFKHVGKDNFEALNNLVNEYYKRFGFGITGQLAIADYYHDKPNEHSDMIKEFITKRDIIMDNMRNYLQSIKTTDSISK